MMYIEGHLETVDTLQDIAKIIREYYNPELADEMDKLIEIKEAEIRDLQLELHNTTIYGDDDDWYDD